MDERDHDHVEDEDRFIEAAYRGCLPVRKAAMVPEQRNPIAELEKWKSGHKARSCWIEADCGYSTWWWTVRLSGEGKRKVKETEEVEGGLGATILAALDKWQAS